MWKVANTFEDLQPTRFDRFMSGITVLDGDDAIMVSPHNPRRQVSSQIEPIKCVYDLPARLERLGVTGRGNRSRYTARRRYGSPYQTAIQEHPYSVCALHLVSDWRCTQIRRIDPGDWQRWPQR